MSPDAYPWLVVLLVSSLKLTRLSSPNMSGSYNIAEKLLKMTIYVSFNTQSDTIDFVSQDKN